MWKVHGNGHPDGHSNDDFDEDSVNDSDVNVNWTSGANWPFGYCPRAELPEAGILFVQMLNIDSDKLGMSF